jgi:hypothetical protein
VQGAEAQAGAEEESDAVHEGERMTERERILALCNTPEFREALRRSEEAFNILPETSPLKRVLRGLENATINGLRGPLRIDIGINALTELRAEVASSAIAVTPGYQGTLLGCAVYLADGDPLRLDVVPVC